MSGEMGEQSAACKKEDGGKAACDKERKDAVVSETSGNVSCADKMERRVQGNEVSALQAEGARRSLPAVVDPTEPTLWLRMWYF